jgi:excisionase family DNA binding protein
MITEKLTFTVHEVAEALGINEKAAYDLVKTDGFPAIWIGKRIIVPVAAFVEWMNTEAKKSRSED